MAWDHLSINKPHLVYIILGGFTSLFMLCSSFIKERLYIGEATVATICGVIFGPHAANLIDPHTWGNTDQITLEFSRIVLVVQCFAVGVELPKYYMEKHWKSVIFLLLPVMTFGWLITSLFVWWLIEPLTWLESLCVAACVTATDPVLASSVVGKGKFAKRVPKHLRDLLSAESGCNDGMAFPFIYLALYLIHYRTHPNEVAFHWIVLTILYECVFGAIYGFIIGYIGRHGIKYAEKHNLVDRESFLVFYFVLALFCAGSGSILGVDDLLVGFAAGIGFSNDGWFTQKTEESHVSNVIDLLINLAYFVYLGTIIPWEQFNTPSQGITPWRLVVISIFVLLFRRIPIMLALKPIIPDIKTWREALFAGHFGPIGVGAIFIAILARAELQTDSTTPLAEYENPEAENYLLVTLIWPITVFLVIVSIIVHGSSIAVFTLGRHLNTLTLTMSYTKADEDGPSWMNRLPRITTTSKSQAKSFNSENDADLDLPPGSLPPTGVAGEFGRRQTQEGRQRNSSRSSSLIPRRRKKKDHGAGGPVSESAIYPQRRITQESTSDTLTQNGSPDKPSSEYNEKNESELGNVQHDPEMEEIMHRSADNKSDKHKSDAERHPSQTEIYKEGEDFVIENEDGDVLKTIHSGSRSPSHSPIKRRKASPRGSPSRKEKVGTEEERSVPGDKKKAIEAADYRSYKTYKKWVDDWRHRDDHENPGNMPKQRGAAHAYQVGNTVVIEDEDGEVIKTYELPNKDGNTRPAVPRKLSTWAGLGGLMGRKESTVDSSLEKQPESAEPGSSQQQSSAVRQGIARMGTWGWGKNESLEKKEGLSEDDTRLRFTIGSGGERLTKEAFLKQIQTLDPKARAAAVEKSNASPAAKEAIKRHVSEADDDDNSARARQALRNSRRRQEESSDDSDSETDVQRRAGMGALQLSRRKDAPIAPSTGRMGKVASYDDDEPETAAERKRREKAMKGVEESDNRPVSSASSTGPRGRGSQPRSADVDEQHSGGYFTETPAEKRRREAALGLSSPTIGNDGTKDEQIGMEEPAMPKPAVQTSRGIRFADEQGRR